MLGDGSGRLRALVSLYPLLIRRAPGLWGALYHTANTQLAFAGLLATLGRGVRRALRRRLEEEDFDLVLSVHPLLNHVALQAAEGGGRPRGLVVVVTDLVECHRGWACPGADLVVAPTEPARRSLIRLGVPPPKVQVLGLPVGAGFRPPRPGEKQLVRRRLRLAESRPLVLVVGGGEGFGPILEQVRALAAEEHPWQLAVVCGRNRRLQDRLARLPLATPTLLLGFVDDMPELMRAADLLVTKAGPGAIAEAAASGLPLILTGYLPGQETPNVRFVTAAGAGVFAPRPTQLPGLAHKLLAGGGVQARVMGERALALARPAAAEKIARQCLRLARLYRAASQARR